MAGPFGRYCFPLMKCVAKANYAANVVSTAKKLKNEKLGKSQRVKAEQQRLAALKVVTRQGSAYVDNPDQVLAFAKCRYVRKEGEDGPLDEDEHLGHKSPNWENWKWDGDKVIVSEHLKLKKSEIETAAKAKDLKFEQRADVNSLRK